MGGGGGWGGGGGGGGGGLLQPNLDPHLGAFPGDFPYKEYKGAL